MKQKVKKLSLRYKILIPAVILIVVVCVVLGTYSYLTSKQALIEQGSEEAMLIASIAAEMVDSSLIEKALAEGEDSEAYEQATTSLNHIKERTGIKYLYSIYTQDGGVYYGVDATAGEDHSNIGDEFEAAYEEMREVFDGTAFAEDEMTVYEDFGALISAYAPLYNSSGEIIGALGCDYNAQGVYNRTHSYLLKMVLMAVILMLFAIIIVNVIISVMIVSIRKVNQKIYDLANTDGDLTAELEIHSGDEMELIADNVNALLRYIRQVILNITSGSKQLRTSSEVMLNKVLVSNDNISTISSTMQQIAAGCEETSASIESIRGVIEDTNEIVGDANKSIQKTCETSYRIIDEARTTHQAAEASRRNALQRAKEMEISMQEKIRCSKDVEKINELTQNILNISSQTNLLSLNASIEAARAGEAGRGFSVVAGEISTLASNSAQAANEIRQVSEEIIGVVAALSEEAGNMLKLLEEATNDGYGRLLETSENYEKNMEYLTNQFAEMAEFCQNLNSKFNFITESIEAIDKASEESTLGINNVASSTTDIASEIAVITDEAGDVGQVSEKLTTEVKKFKV